MGFKIPAGRAKDTPIEEATENDLRWWRNKMASGLEENPGKQYADKDRAWIAAADQELARRGAGGAPATPPPQPAAMATASPAAAAGYKLGSHRDERSAAINLEAAARFAHLVSPAPTVGALPEGCSLTMSSVLVEEADTYPIADKRGIGKVALDKISGAAGVSWDPRECGRQDDGADPHYCHYKAVGRVRNFDGTIRVLTGEVEIDMREGSPSVEAIRVREANKRAKDGANYRGDGGDKEIGQIRGFILRHAESKAKNRAIRSLGIRPAYTKDELKKPFVVAKIQFTGHSDDPATKAMFAGKMADAFLGSAGQLYGSDSPRAPTAHRALHAPPPVGVSEPDPEDYGYGEPDQAASPSQVHQGEVEDRGADANAY